MEVSAREGWTIIHGLVVGTVFLVAFAGGVAGLWSLREELVTVEGIKERMRRLYVGIWGMAIIAWVTVVTGTYVIYPWYRATPPEGADLTHYPRSFLLADPDKDLWHKFGMEWKEHIAWAAPILATAVAFVVSYYGARLARDNKLRWLTMAVFAAAFGAAAVAGVFGAFINKAAPVR
jgi:hypothetical protein